MRVGSLIGPFPAGVVGKLPAHGDFVRLGADGIMLARLDRWLAMELGRVDPATLEDRLPALLTWHFLLSEARGSRVGVVMASRDSVGRAFPLIGYAVAENGVGLSDARRWCVSAEETLRAMCDAGERATTIVSALSAMSVVAEDDDAAAEDLGTIWWTSNGTLVRYSDLPAGDDFAQLLKPEGVSA